MPMTLAWTFSIAMNVHFIVKEKQLRLKGAHENDGTEQQCPLESMVHHLVYCHFHLNCCYCSSTEVWWPLS